MTLGDLVKKYREKHNISMDEFSKMCALSKGYISMLENNINPRSNKPIAPTLPTIKKIATAMNADIDSILKIIDSNQEISLDPRLEGVESQKENTAIRLNKIMLERNLRQVDILDRVKPFCAKYDVKMSKSDLSQYVSGKVEPSQEKLVVLGMALNVSEAWLMGFDVPMERQSNDKNKESSSKIIQYYNRLNDLGKHEAEKRVEELTFLPQYTLEVKAAHNDYLDEPGELERMKNDLSSLKRPDTNT